MTTTAALPVFNQDTVALAVEKADRFRDFFEKETGAENGTYTSGIFLQHVETGELELIHSVTVPIVEVPRTPRELLDGHAAAQAAFEAAIEAEEDAVAEEGVLDQYTRYIAAYLTAASTHDAITGTERGIFALTDWLSIEAEVTELTAQRATLLTSGQDLPEDLDMELEEALDRRLILGGELRAHGSALIAALIEE